ncbi:MAG: hypothetical protein ACPGWM_08685 [Flavobacteriales bacterium]
MDTATEEQKKDRLIASVITFNLSVLVLILCIFLTAFSLPDPLPGETFVAVGMADYGSVVEASGETESENPSESQENNEAESQTTSETVEANTAPEVVTQEASPVVTPSGTNTTTPTKPTPEPDPEPEPQVSKGLGNILDKINETGGGGPSEGTGEGVGNEGTESGSIDGMGVVSGDGIGFSLGDRGMTGRPKLSEQPKEEGRVVLDIYVDRNGNVLETRANYDKSNTSSSYLFELAKKAAKKAKFQVSANAPPKQKGSMTFIFKLN